MFQIRSWVMLQIGSYCNNHLIINVMFKWLGVKAGIDPLPLAIFVIKTKGKRIIKCSGENTGVILCDVRKSMFRCYYLYFLVRHFKLKWLPS